MDQESRIWRVVVILGTKIEGCLEEVWISERRFYRPNMRSTVKSAAQLRKIDFNFIYLYLAFILQSRVSTTGKTTSLISPFPQTKFAADRLSPVRDVHCTKG
jgi:hypothetical protein